MRITQKYWGDYMGGSDDSLTLLEYLAGKGKEEIPLGEIFSDFGVDKLAGNFQDPEEPLVYTSPEGWEMEIHSAASFLTDLAVLLLECKVNGGLDTRELEMDTDLPLLRISAAPAERDLVDKALEVFSNAPLDSDLRELVPEVELLEMAKLCGELREELSR